MALLLGVRAVSLHVHLLHPELWLWGIGLEAAILAVQAIHPASLGDPAESSGDVARDRSFAVH